MIKMENVVQVGNDTLLEKTIKDYHKLLKIGCNKKGNLLGIIKQTLLQNDPKNYYLAMDSQINLGSVDGVFYSVNAKVAFVNKAIIEIQKSLEKIYRIARNNVGRDIDYGEIIKIFEKEYRI